MFLLCRHQNSDNCGRNGTTETKTDAEAKTRDRYCHSGTSVGPDPGEASTSAESKTTQVGHNSHLFHMVWQYGKNQYGNISILYILRYGKYVQYHR